MTTPTTNIGRRLEIVSWLLQHEARTERGLGVTSVAERLHREKSQISRGLRSLLDADLVERDDDSLEYHAGARLLALAARAGHPQLRRAAWPVLAELAAALGERANLNVLHGGQVLTVDTAAGPSTVQSVGWSGRTTPVHCTAAGRALLIDADRDALRRLVGADPLPPCGPQGAASLRVLADRIAIARRDGFAIADGEFDADVVAVSAPVRDAAGSVVAAITVSGPSERFRQRLTAAAARVRAAAGELSGV